MTDEGDSRRLNILLFSNSFACENLEPMPKLYFGYVRHLG